MKKIFIAIVIATVFLSGCQWLDDLRLKILKQVDTTTVNVTKKVEDVSNQIKTTKQAVDQKINDIENAATKVKEAVDAVKKVTGDAPSTSSGQVGTTTTTAGTTTAIEP
jgi:outer membrane murein-binding lipoprotein Lpp